jgi:septal ring factor EnvC (AmiA/AmiB activator)
MILPNETVELIKKDSNELQQKIESLKITTEEEYTEAGELLIAVTKRKKRMEELREEKSRPLLDQIAENRKFFKFFEEPLEAMDKLLRSGIQKYAQIKFEAEQKKVQEAAQKAKEEAAKNKTEAVPVEAVKPSLGVRTTGGSVTMKRRWTFEVLDLKDVPQEFLSINDKAVNEAIRSGVREIKGVRIFETVDPTVR